MFLFAATILLSAFLLFLVQPVIAKQILPWFGGSSAVWTTCMVFFQVLLLGGYAYSHFITRRLRPRMQMWLHIALLAASLAFLPIIPRESLKPTGSQDAALGIIVLLGATIGLPYFLLSSTGPLVQKWVAHRFPERTVYRLFALSNFGSLLGLLAFPFAIEPFANSRTQSIAWSSAYTVFVIACALTAWQSVQRGAHLEAAPTEPTGEAPPTAGAYLLWLAFAALGSVLLLASTSHITQNITSVPFLWVLPLSLYLLTFVVAFEGRGGRGWYDPRWGIYVALAFTVAMAAGLSASRGVLDISLAVPLYCLGVFFACLFCHGELAHRKPAPRYLTHFYLSLSAGGAIGGLFVGLVAPRVFPAFYELPLALSALALLAILAAWTNRALSRPWLVATTLTALVASLVTTYFAWYYFDFLRGDVILMQRNFYGALRVRETGKGDQKVRRLLHGVILHGEQYVNSPDRLEPGSYYSRTSGVGVAIAVKEQHGPIRLGVVGLGAGTLSAYGRAGDTVRFYELNPVVVKISHEQFSYLNSSPAKIEFVMGDARLSMEREIAAGYPQRYDVLAIDAFSSDSIPVHLITREAIEIYRKELAPGGIVAVHISNRFLDLKPVLANIGAVTGMTVRLVADSPSEESGASSTDWVLMAEHESAFEDPKLAERVEMIQPNPAFSLWTDQFNNLLDVLKSRPLDAIRSLVDPD